MDIVNLVVMNIIFLAGPVCLFLGVRAIVHYLQRKETRRPVFRVKFCDCGFRRIFGIRRG